jgi:hypothetical protein
MPKKRTAKDQARYYTNTSQRRAPLPNAADEQIKDVTTQLRELRIEYARERLLSQPSPKMTTADPLPIITSSLGFKPANYVVAPYINPLSEPTSSSTVARTTRRIPGPAPPKSWLEPQHKPLFQQLYRVRSRNYLEAPFPDIEMPDQNTLIHSSLLTLGTHFFEHQEYNKYNLPQLGIQLKQWLLTYIATRNLAGAITKEGLNVLFPRTKKPEDPDEMVEIIALSNEDEQYTRCLDLTDSDISIKYLRTFLSPLSPTKWEEPRFPNLTHLSLERSSLQPAKIDHLTLVNVLSRQCSRLTHLNLAGILPRGSGGSLYQLSKSLVCLEYIDISRNIEGVHTQIDLWGQDAWGSVSAWEDERDVVNQAGSSHVDERQVTTRVAGEKRGWSPLLYALNWDGGWRRVSCLIARKCGFEKEAERKLQEKIFEKRGDRGWTQVVFG